ncbi:Branched-chain amino acid ABC transporter, amino acid-binding protein (TC 3.A.1.4.1) [Olavius sp. associated proteobacterium Delta 1]|nr:Branched-chain amino acid ABC transporter, amino acid-binding protein (TC 3.A.1.4.1) [Olavius sp. associated proteobacterium Delta 1]
MDSNVLYITLIIIGSTCYAADTIKIGLMAPLSGEFGDIGEEVKKHIELASDEVNAAGGILGRKVEVILFDTQTKPTVASDGAKKLINQHNVSAIIGDLHPFTTKSIRDVIEGHNIINITYGAVELPNGNYKNFFRTSPRYEESAQVTVDTIKNLEFKRIGILYGAEKYIPEAERIKSMLNKEGRDVVYFNSFNDSLHFNSNIINELIQKNPDVVYLAGSAREVAPFLKQKTRIPKSIKFIGGPNTKHSELIRLAGENVAEGFMSVALPEPEELGSKVTKKFLNKYKSRYQRPAESIWGGYAADAFKIVADAMEKTGSNDSEVLVNYLMNELRDFDGVSGKITFNKKGERTNDLYRAFSVNNGRNVMICSPGTKPCRLNPNRCCSIESSKRIE